MTTYFHCAAGIRVHPAADILRSMGFERVVPLQEGFAQLAQSGRFLLRSPKGVSPQCARGHIRSAASLGGVSRDRFGAP